MRRIFRVPCGGHLEDRTACSQDTCTVAMEQIGRPKYVTGNRGAMSLTSVEKMSRGNHWLAAHVGGIGISASREPRDVSGRRSVFGGP